MISEIKLLSFPISMLIVITYEIVTTNPRNNVFDSVTEKWPTDKMTKCSKMIVLCGIC